MTLTEKGDLLRKRFLQKSFGQLLQTRNEYSMLFNVLSDKDVQNLDDLNVFFCQSIAPASVTELNNTLAVATIHLIAFETNYLFSFNPEEVVAIVLHEIGHVFFPHDDLQQREFNADDFVKSKGFGKYIKSSLITSIRNTPRLFDNPINHARVLRLTN